MSKDPKDPYQMIDRRGTRERGGNAELAKAISAKTGISVVKCKDVVEAMVEVIYETLTSGGTVCIENLGTFEIREAKPAYTAFEYRPPRPAPRFRFSEACLDFMAKQPLDIIPGNKRKYTPSNYQTSKE